MIEKNIAAHPKESFSTPQTLFNGDVLFPDTQMHALMEPAASEEKVVGNGVKEIDMHAFSGCKN